MSEVQKMDLRGDSTAVFKSYYVNFCVKRVYTEDTRDQQMAIDLPSSYVPSDDANLMQMKAEIDDCLTFFTNHGEGIIIKSFSRMDL